MKTLVYLPSASDEYDFYAEKMKLLINESYGAGLAIASFPRKEELLRSPIRLFLSLFTKKTDVIVLNWHENLLRSKSGGISILGLFEFFLYFFIYKLSSRHIIYVRHNISPHGMNKISAKIAIKLTSLMENWCESKVAHSGHLGGKGYTYIPHPLFDPTKSSPLIRGSRTEGEQPYSVIFGGISRYKNIESVVRAWSDKKRLIVAGNNNDAGYLGELKALARGKNISIDARYLEEDEAQSLVANADELILAHSDEDMIVSGSFFYSISLGTPVHAIATPFFVWLKETQEFEGLRIFYSAEVLVNELREDGAVNHNVIHRVREQAEALFGDSIVRNAWGDLIRRTLL